jgi:hypothetical protein
MKRVIRKHFGFVLIAVVLFVTGCGSKVRVGAVEFGIEPTATPVPTPTLTPTPSPTVETYRNDEYGFAFDYLSTWTLSEEPHFVRLQQDNLRLTIGYRWTTEMVSLWHRTGMPAGDLIYSAKIVFLGQVIPAHTLEYERKAKGVYYGENGRAEVGNLQFALHLEDPNTRDYEAVDIPELVQAEVKVLLESFRRIEATGQPPVPSPTPLPVPTRTPTPGPSADEVTVVGWYGSVHSAPAGSGYDDYLSVLPEGAAEVGLVGQSPADEAAIAELRDKEPPNKYAHFWGTLRCGEDDYGSCRLYVTHMRPDGPGPMLNPDPVEGWEGTVVTSSAMAQVDDAFVLAGDYPVQYGVWSEDPDLAARLEGYRNSGTAIRVWGQVLCGVPDANGCQIQVSRLEESPATAGPASAPSVQEEEWASYDNEEFGFSFQYPATWTLEEVPGQEIKEALKYPPGAMAVRFADAVVLRLDRLALTIQYYRKSDPGPVSWWGGAATEVEPVNQDKAMILGRESFRTFYGSPGAVKEVYTQYAHEDADLVLDIRLRDSSETAFTADELATIPEPVLIELDQILSSFERVQ